MTKTQRIPLPKGQLVGKVKNHVFSNATLLVHQKYISDGLGDYLPSSGSWEIQILDGVPADFLLSSEIITFEADKYSGECVANGNNSLKGIGPVAGISER